MMRKARSIWQRNGAILPQKQGLLDVQYDGYFTFEASYTLLSPSLELKKQAVDLLYEVGKYILETYQCFEE